MLGRNIQQLSHHWTETHTCTAERQKIAECTLSNMGPQRSRWQSFPHRTAQCKYSTSDSSRGWHYKKTGCLQRQHATPSTIEVARFLHVFVLGRNIQQLSHHWTETHTCTAERQKVAECALSNLGPQRSRWQSFPHRTAQCKYSTSDSSPGSPCCRVHVPHALHYKRTGCLQRQHARNSSWCIPTFVHSIPLPPSTTKVARSLPCLCAR